MTILDNDALRIKAPSIFALEPWQKMSERYRFVPTIDVVNTFKENNFFPVYAGQSSSRLEGKGNYTRHVLRFRRLIDIDRPPKDEIPELVLINSHDGSSCYKLMLGIFRIVCSNGLVVSTASIAEINTKHLGNGGFFREILEASATISENIPSITEKIASWKDISLTDYQQVVFAESALKLRDSTLELKPEQVLIPRRYEDRNNSLWHTYNRVQENLHKGGLRGVNTQGKRIRTRAVKSVSEDIRLNRALWNLTEAMEKIVKGKAGFEL